MKNPIARLTAVAAIAMTVLFGAAACAESEGEVSGSQKDALNLTEYEYEYEGATLHCVGYEPGYRAGLLSCDWVRFHAENDGAANG